MFSNIFCSSLFIKCNYHSEVAIRQYHLAFPKGFEYLSVNSEESALSPCKAEGVDQGWLLSSVLSPQWGVQHPDQTLSITCLFTLLHGSRNHIRMRGGGGGGREVKRSRKREDKRRRAGRGGEHERRSDEKTMEMGGGRQEEREEGKEVLLSSQQMKEDNRTR